MLNSKFKRPDLILDLYAESGNIGVWYCDKITGEDEVSEEWAQMIGYHAEELNPMSDEKFVSLIHPDDLKSSLPKINEFYYGHTNTYENEFRFRHKEGHYVWVLSQAKIYSRENDRPKLIIGTHINIDDQKKSVEKLRKLTMSIISAFSMVIELKDRYTKHHLESTAEIAVKIGKKIGMTYEEQEQLWMAGHLHDLGKVQIPIEILNKEGRLTKEEYEVIKTHSLYGYEILKEFDFGFPLADIVAQHHERLDGSGYPKGLKGDEIHYMAKIIAVADVLDALQSDRSYRSKMSKDEIITILKAGAGIHFEPELVKVCCELLMSPNDEIK